MKITDIQIERFGIWEDLHLPLSASGLNVFYGPNEAGKTTLMKFIRGLLYGYRSDRTPRVRHGVSNSNCDGRLQLENRGQLYEVRRRSDDTARGRISIEGHAEGDTVEEKLDRLLSHTQEDVFENVFAIGLHELQELATLHGEEVARHIYGMTLGPEGRRLLQVSQDVDERAAALLGSDGHPGGLGRLFTRQTELNEELHRLGDYRQLYTELRSRRAELEARIRDHRSRHASNLEQLAGHRFLEQVWNPWSEVVELQQQLAALPKVSGFPADGRQRLAVAEQELQSLTAKRKKLLQNAAGLKRQADELITDSEWRKREATVQFFIDQREWIGELQEQSVNSRQEADRLRVPWNQTLAELGDDWTPPRLQAVDTSPLAHHRLTTTAASYRTAVSRRNRMRRTLRRLSKSNQRSTARLDDRLKNLEGATVEESLALRKRELRNLEQLSALRLREAALAQEERSTTERIEDVTARAEVPGWVFWGLGFFAVAGTFFCIVGLIAGVQTSFLAGLTYALLGITGIGMAWAWKRHYEGSADDTLERLYAELRRHETELRQVREEIQRITQGSGASPLNIAHAAGNSGQTATSPDSGTPTEAQQMRHCIRRIDELERLERAQQRNQRRRRRVSQLRVRFQTVQRSASQTTQAWCDQVKQLGLEENLKVAEVFELWQKLATANEQRQRWETANHRAADHTATWQAFRRRMEELGHRLSDTRADYDQPLTVLARWDEQLRELGRQRTEQRRLRREEQALRREADQIQEQIEELKNLQAALLVQGGATNREEFEERASWLDRHAELEELLQIARADFDAARQSQPDLAIVQEDLEQFDQQKNAAEIARLEQEIRQLDGTSQATFEELGQIKKQMQDLESDRRPTRLRFERSQLDARTRAAAEEWFAVQMTGSAVERMRARFERHSQPDTLAAASRILERLTRGKYRNIWAPLGRRHLCVDDEQQQTFRVDQLSGGTREQLFLAIRLALVDEFRSRGIELPMVLDDVFVNFDQSRTEAAVETLLEFAESGQQILFFTCHLHLAHLFEQRHLNPIWLPGHHRTAEERRAG